MVEIVNPEAISEWIKVIAPVITLVTAAGVIPLYQWSAKRKDDQGREIADRGMTAGERREKALIDERAALSAEQREAYERIEAALTRAMSDIDLQRKAMIDLAKDRDRGWNLARYWHGAIYSMTTTARNALRDCKNARSLTLVTMQRLQKFDPSENIPDWDVLPDLPSWPKSLEEPPT